MSSVTLALATANMNSRIRRRSSRMKNKPSRVSLPCAPRLISRTMIFFTRQPRTRLGIVLRIFSSVCFLIWL